jgi:hypothetical protein
MKFLKKFSSGDKEVFKQSLCVQVFLSFF